MNGIILYYVVGLPHVRHAAALRPCLNGWSIRFVYEPALPWFAWRPPSLAGVEAVALRFRRLPKGLWRGRVGALLFATAQPRSAPIRLLAAAMERGVPTIGLEETYQMALNGGRVHNYVLPLDRVLVASAVERDGFVRAGVPPHRLEITGWPFGPGQTAPIAVSRAQQARQRLRVDPDRRIAVLILSGLHEAGEDWEARHRQLALVVEGLPNEYRLYVRPHPAERLAPCRAWLARRAPAARLLEGSAPIEEVLEAADIVINRGASQVCMEALVRDLPLVILETAWPTAFYELMPEVVARAPAEVPVVLDRVLQPERRRALYERFLGTQVMAPPSVAREHVCRRMRDIAERGVASQDGERSGQWFRLALYAAWRGERRVATQACAQAARSQTLPCDALERLIRCRAQQGDLMSLQVAIGEAFDATILRALWIRQLWIQRAAPDEATQRWIGRFPPSVNTPWFVADTQRWAVVLQRHRLHEALIALVEQVWQEYRWHPELRRMAERFSRRRWGGQARHVPPSLTFTTG